MKSVFYPTKLFSGKLTNSVLVERADRDSSILQ